MTKPKNPKDYYDGDFVWNIIEEYTPTFNGGNITKYLLRFNGKNGFQDIAKSQDYATRLRTTMQDFDTHKEMPFVKAEEIADKFGLEGNIRSAWLNHITMGNPLMTAYLISKHITDHESLKKVTSDFQEFWCSEPVETKVMSEEEAQELAESL